jgi:hypothetical protein
MRARDTASHLAEMPVRHGDLIVTFGYDLVDNRLSVTEIRIVRADGGPVPVAARPPLARLAAHALDELRTRWAPQILRLKPSETAVEAARILTDALGPRMGRPPLYDPQHWAEVAEVAKEGTNAVAERWSLSYATAWRWCREAEKLT